MIINVSNVDIVLLFPKNKINHYKNFERPREKSVNRVIIKVLRK